ncbi:MAG: hypothetical protein ACRCY3_16560 [Sphingorhabdus sp.]
MQKVVTFLFSSLTHVAYFAIFLQAFVMPPPIEYFRPCACTPVAREMETILTVTNILKPTSSGSVHLVDAALKSNDKFCPDSQNNDYLALRKDLTLSPQLENLIVDIPSSVQICLKLNALGQVLDVTSRSRNLSTSDQLLISKHIKDNWSFEPDFQLPQHDFAGSYALNLSVHLTEIR